MKIESTNVALILSTLLLGACAGSVSDQTTDTNDTQAIQQPLRACDHDSHVDTDDASGVLRTTTADGAPIDGKNPFFARLGTNGRTCASCHVAESGWTITPSEVRSRFEATRGMDPIFRTNDGATSPNADVSSLGSRRVAYAMLLDKGLVRVGLPIPANAEFELVRAEDPYGFASASELSLFRRPLPSTNLRFLSTVMWDGRETFRGQSLHFDLADQAIAATRGHAHADRDLTDAEREAIVAFETNLSTAQVRDNRAGSLDVAGGRGGPATLLEQPFFLGINDPFGQNPKGAFTADAFTLYQAWARGPEERRGRNDARSREAAREQIARGEKLFDELPIAISGVSGLNDELGVPTLVGHCTTCHDTPNVGNHSLAAPLDIGIADASRRTSDMPLYTLRNKTTHAEIRTTDPGRALVTGLWKDVGRFKGPVLRGLAARAPYFHNGSAASLEDVVTFYDGRFGLALTAAQKADLAAFLRAL